MPPRTKRSTTTTKKKKAMSHQPPPPKKRRSAAAGAQAAVDISKDSNPEQQRQSLSDLYEQWCGSSDAPPRHGRSSAGALLSTTVWPAVAEGVERVEGGMSWKPWRNLCRLAAVLISHEYREGVTADALDFIWKGGSSDDSATAWTAFLDTLLDPEDDGSRNNGAAAAAAVLWSVRAHCLATAFAVVQHPPAEAVLWSALRRHLLAAGQLWHCVPPRGRDLLWRRRLRGSAGDDRGAPPAAPWEGEDGSDSETPPFLVRLLRHVLQLLESHEFQEHLLQKEQKKVDPSLHSGVGEEEDDDDDQKDVESIADVAKQWLLVHRTFELLGDLLSSPPLSGSNLRKDLIPYLHFIHWTVRCRRALVAGRDENCLLAQQLHGRVERWIRFPVSDDDAGGAAMMMKPLNTVEWRSLYHRRAVIFQKMCQRYYADQLADIVYAAVGVLCHSVRTDGRGEHSAYLRHALEGLPDKDLTELLYKMRLIEDDDRKLLEDGTLDRSFLLEVLEDYLVMIPDQEDPVAALQSFPLFPTEALLWDYSRVPASHMRLFEAQQSASPVLSLPKLQTRFLSFSDYLLRNFELSRVESAHEIRSDLTDVIRRVRPVVRHETGGDDVEAFLTQHVTIKTEFAGWARMALEMQGTLEIKKVERPLLGEKFPSQVLAEIAVDLAPCGESIRREWNELGEHDNLFLVAVDARQMTGERAPEMQGSERRVPDEDDPTFPARFGVKLVRGCAIVQVRDEAGTVLTEYEPGTTGAPAASGTKRIFLVKLDPAQYWADFRSPIGTDMYQSLNLVVRRHGKVNNFRSVLETIRGLMIGMGSINRVIPSWLQSILLGQGDPKEASYESETVKAYARKTAGVVNPDAFLDYGDTFLDEEHLRTSFADTNVTVDGREEFSKESDAPRCNYRVRMLEKGGKRIMDAVSYPFPQGISGNPVRFTPRQVQAIRSGLSPGLSIVVGPPGTGKTDVAVQIIASLYHSFPTQRTVIITHSNAALNDIFQKVMARGDVEERYLLRLGSGERELQVESTHDFTKVGRVAYSFARRGVLLEKVQVLSESLGLSGRAERGADGSPSYTCETAEYFQKHQVQRRRNEFERSLKESNITTDHADVSSVFPFAAYFEAYDKPVTLAQAREYFDKLDAIFSELAEYRPLELLRSQRQRSDYLIMKQARIVAMTCTHAAISRSHLIKLGFEYDNVVVEEAGQMLEIEAFIPLLLQRGEIESSRGRLKRVCLMGDHNQLPPVIQNLTIARYCNLDQSLFSRLIRLGVPYIQFDKQGRARPEIASLYSWRYENLGNLDQVLNSGEFGLANPAFAHTFQIINVEDFQGRGESSPTSYFYQNVGEAEYVVALFQYMVLIGYSPRKISILTTYNGQRELIGDVLSQRCGEGTPLAGVRPRVVSTVDQYQGQQNDFVLLSLVRTESVGHLRDVRRLVVAVSRARLGLYVFCRQELFSSCHELKQTFDQFAARPNKLQLVLGENYPSERKVADEIPKDKLYEIDDVAHLGSVVHQMQEDWIKAQT